MKCGAWPRLATPFRVHLASNPHVLMRYRKHAIGYAAVKQSEVPDDFGHRTRRCRICDAWLCRFNPEPICWHHQPGGEGVLIEVADGDWRRFTVPELLGNRANDRKRADDLLELLSEAP